MDQRSLFLLDSNRELPYLLTQRDWLKTQLQQSRARWKIVVLHHPLFSIRSASRNLIQRWVFNSLLEDYGVDLVLQAHEHNYARMTAHEDGVATTPVYTVSHCSPKNYDLYQNERYDRFGTESRYYQTIDLSGDTLTMATYEALSPHALRLPAGGEGKSANAAHGDQRFLSEEIT